MEEKAVFHLRYQLVFSVTGIVLISVPVTAGIVLSGYIHFDSHLKNCIIEEAAFPHQNFHGGLLVQQQHSD